MLENIVLKRNGDVDFNDSSITENTRATYPIDYIDGAILEGVADHPKAIIMLTADAFGVLPPVSILDENSAEYHFLSGYTAKVAGTERGIKEPKATFSACFGAPFMPRPAKIYAEMLKKRMQKYNVKAYLINTGWYGGPYGIGKRYNINDTRAIVASIIDGRIQSAKTVFDEMLNLLVPISIDGIDNNLLDYRNKWADKKMYNDFAKKLIEMFKNNYEEKFNIKKTSND